MKRRLVSVSPWILAAACTLLAGIIGVFAVNNYSREKKLMTDALVQKGLAVIRYLDNGLMVSMRANWQSSNQAAFGLIDHAQNVIDQVRDQSDIHFVELIDDEGTILAATDTTRIGKKVSDDTIQFLQLSKEGRPVFRMHLDSGDAYRGFQVSQSYKPRMRGFMSRNNQRGRQMMERLGSNNPAFHHMQLELEKARGREFFLLVELDQDQFDSAVTRQRLEIIILSFILLLVGIGGWLSLLTLQGFRGTQTRLQRISAFNDILVESLPVGLIATDGNGIIQVVNSAAEEIAGGAEKSIIGKAPVSVLPQELGVFFAEVTAQKTPRSSEVEVITGGGQRQNLLLTRLSVADVEGNVTGEVLLMQDISELRQLETKLQRNERMAALGKMAAGVAHELRNPLSSIKGLAILLKGKTAGDPEGVQTAEVLVQEVERLNRSISELLDYARPEQLNTQSASLDSILQEAVDLVGVDASSLGIAICTDFNDEGENVVMDTDKIKQVFLNLLLNGMQAMVDGGTLSLKTEVKNKQLHCTIEDNGVGIKDEHKNRVFDPYFTTKSEGTGLGLSLSAKIIEEHGGTISLESEAGKGTAVTVQLPLNIGSKSTTVPV